MKTLPLVLLLAVAVSGCVWRSHYSSSHSTTYSEVGGGGAGREQLTLQYCRRDGHAILECERVVLVFPDVAPDQQEIFGFGTGKQVVQVSGPGTAMVTVRCTRNGRRVDFCSSYSDGTNTLRFGNASVQFCDHGRALIAGAQRIDLTTNRPIVEVRDAPLGSRP